MSQFSVKFWGTRGSIACSGPEYAVFGGNTPCVEFILGQRSLIFDAGTGFRECGRKFYQNPQKDLHLFLSHTHLDHIAGLPFFAPLFASDQRLTIWAGHIKTTDELINIISKMIEPPLFPIPIDHFAAKVEYKVFEVDKVINPYEDVVMTSCHLNHPDGACGYRIDYGGYSACYITDTEHKIGEPDQNILNMIKGTDLLIYDGMYNDKIFPRKIGWGHSTWEEAVRLAKAANVKRLAIFHHDPCHNDQALQRREDHLKEVFPSGFFSKDGQVVILGQNE
jgi:phosphoribosyl 1,2-cyclic phosphodiesterase